MNEIEHQCLLEFFAEGHRFDDLKRWYSPSELQLIFQGEWKTRCGKLPGKTPLLSYTDK